MGEKLTCQALFIPGQLSPHEWFSLPLSLQYLAFTCGLVRGGLSNLGVKSIVTAEVSVMPACKEDFSLW